VLLVEDDGLIRASTAEIMRDLGHTVCERAAQKKPSGCSTTRPSICSSLTLDCQGWTVFARTRVIKLAPLS